MNKNLEFEVSLFVFSRRKNGFCPELFSMVACQLFTLATSAQLTLTSGLWHWSFTKWCSQCVFPCELFWRTDDVFKDRLYTKTDGMFSKADLKNRLVCCAPTYPPKLAPPKKNYCHSEEICSWRAIVLPLALALASASTNVKVLR